jgi:hypothetical protein
MLFRITEDATTYFVRQRRKGYGKAKGLSSIIVGTFDSIFDTKPPPFRILHQTPSSELYWSKFHISTQYYLCKHSLNMKIKTLLFYESNIQLFVGFF